MAQVSQGRGGALAKIDVTPAMVRAGVNILDCHGENLPQEAVAEWVFLAMTEAAQNRAAPAVHAAQSEVPETPA